MSEKPVAAYRLHALQVENFKRLVAVDIRPDGRIVQITGKNSSGKSSCLDAIWSAIGGRAAIQSQPIRKGQDEALIKLDLGHLKVKRTFKAVKEGDYTTTLTVTSAEGAKFSNPQAILDSLLSSLAVDPLAFTRMRPKDQFEQLRAMVPGFDFERSDGLSAADYDSRKEINTKVKSLRAQAAAIVVPEALPAAVDEAALVSDLERAGSHNAAIERDRSAREKLFQLVELCRRDAAAARANAEQLRKEADAADATAAENDRIGNEHAAQIAELPSLPDPIDASAVSAALNAARMTNATLAAATRRDDLIADAEIAEAQANALTDAIEAREKAKQDAIAKANLPVPGLALGNGEVLLNGVPFEQASSAEQLRASIGIAMRGDAKLRLCLIKDGSLLDEDSMKLLADMAEEQNFDVIMEVVDSSGEIGVVIEDGRVKNQKLEAAE
jgi:hypothetical protein